MKQNFFYFLSLATSLLAIAFLSSCQNSKLKAELTEIEDITYSPKTQTTLLTVSHTGGCSSSNYDYKYQVLDSDTEDKSISFGLFVDTDNKCQQLDLQFIRMPLPQAIFEPEKLVFESSGNKEIVISSSPDEAMVMPEIELKPQQKIATIEDASYSSQTQKVTLRISLSNGCGDRFDYKILRSDAEKKTAVLALATKNGKKCDFGSYTSVEMPLPQLPFEPEKLIFPISESKKIVLKI